jgi:hypothetical protein
MKIAFLTEGGFEGKYPRNHSNARVDVAWQIALDAYHLPMYMNWENALNYEFDLVIWIIPKKNIDFVKKNYNFIEIMRKISKNVAVMQEGPSWFFQDYPLDQQIWYYNTLCEADTIFAHNFNDLKYFQGLTNHKKVKILSSLMVEDSINTELLTKPEDRNNVIIGGNMCRWYGGFDSMITAQVLELPIYAPAMGRKIEGEEQIVNILPYVQWNEWIQQLSQFKYAVHLMPTQAAGTFAMNCAYLGIPCIGYGGLDTQETLFPYTSVEHGDVQSAKSVLKSLQEDKAFYDIVVDLAHSRYKEYYTENKFKEQFYDQFD